MPDGRSSPEEAALPPGYDDLVAASPDIDRFCSRAAWVTTVHAVWGRGEVVAAAGRDAAVALAAVPVARRRFALAGLDLTWGFACPVVGPDPATGAGLLRSVLASEGRRGQIVILPGLAPGSERERAIAAALERRYELRAGPSMTRRIADLGGGVDAWLRRRSPRFRRNLRQAARRAAAGGITLELGSGGGAEVIDRIVAIEARSLEGSGGSGLSDPTFAAFYRLLAEAERPAGALRAGFARHGDRDVGFILGAVHGTTYRGLQLGFDADYGPYSLGNLLQLEQLAALPAEGVERYDLGMDMAYKVSWADAAFTTRTILATA